MGMFISFDGCIVITWMALTMVEDGVKVLVTKPKIQSSNSPRKARYHVTDATHVIINRALVAGLQRSHQVRRALLSFFSSDLGLVISSTSCMDNFDLQEQIQALQTLSTYNIPGEHDVPSLEPRAVAALLEGAVEAVADSSDAIADPEVFDSYRSILKYAEHVQGATMSKLLDSITSGFQAQVDATLRDNGDDDPQALAARKMILEMYSFLVHWFVLAAERVKGGDEEDAPPPPTKGKRGRGGKAATSRAAAARRVEQWSWQNHIEGILTLISKVFKIKTQRIWVTTGERDTFVKYIAQQLTFPGFYAHNNY